MNELNLPIELASAISVAKEQCLNKVALTYLNAIPFAIERYGVQGLKVQLLYCLNNMSGWRGEKAKAVKLIFKKYSSKNFYF